MSDQPEKKQFKDMTGVVFTNDRRTKDTQPHWTGRVRVNGKELLISMWEKADRPGMMTISLTDPDTLPPRPQSNQNQQQNSNQSNSNQSSTSNKTDGGDDDIFSDLFGSLGQ